MRLRNIPSADHIIAASPFCMQNPAVYQGNWHSVFQNNQPIHIEIGTGKGRFLIHLAQQNPSVNYIGIEKYTSVLLRAVQKLDLLEQPVPNLRFLSIDAKNITEVFAFSEIEKIYLNFSDPWPKKRHKKRRLTSREFLERYHKILAQNGVVEFKTDNRLLFEFSLQEIQEANWTIDAYTYDLHHDSTLNKNNIMTEYEEKFSSLGNPIYKLIASR